MAEQSAEQQMTTMVSAAETLATMAARLTLDGAAVEPLIAEKLAKFDQQTATLTAIGADVSKERARYLDATIKELTESARATATEAVARYRAAEAAVAEAEARAMALSSEFDAVARLAPEDGRRLTARLLDVTERDAAERWVATHTLAQVVGRYQAGDDAGDRGFRRYVEAWGGEVPAKAAADPRQDVEAAQTLAAAIGAARQARVPEAVRAARARVQALRRTVEHASLALERSWTLPTAPTPENVPALSLGPEI